VTGHTSAGNIASYIAAKTLTSINATTAAFTNLTTGSLTSGASTITGDEVIGGNAAIGGNLVAGSYITAGGNITAGLNFITTSNVYAGNVIVTGNVLPAANVTSNIGSSRAYYNTVFSSSGVFSTLTAGNIVNLSANGVTNLYGTAYLNGVTIATVGGSATFASINNTVIGNVTPTSGTFTNLTVTTNLSPSANATVNLGSTGAWFNSIYGTAVHAQYADLAENYQSDNDYSPGTVVSFGEETEVTCSTIENDTRIAGIVSTNPAYLMNGSSAGVAVALQGRVPCKVVGTVRRGDMMVSSSIPGVAMANNNPPIGAVLGKALGHYDSQEVGTIEVVVGRL
jgi:hypothetical protein